MLKMSEMEPMKVKIKALDPKIKFKVPRACKSLNPALHVPQGIACTQGWEPLVLKI
jgi:hypothetical protein